jgi:hypothetical protein
MTRDIRIKYDDAFDYYQCQDHRAERHRESQGCYNHVEELRVFYIKQKKEMQREEQKNQPPAVEKPKSKPPKPVGNGNNRNRITSKAVHCRR